jgi:hypothetical protein
VDWEGMVYDAGERARAYYRTTLAEGDTVHEDKREQFLRVRLEAWDAAPREVLRTEDEYVADAMKYAIASHSLLIDGAWTERPWSWRPNAGSERDWDTEWVRTVGALDDDDVLVTIDYHF